MSFGATADVAVGGVVSALGQQPATEQTKKQDQDLLLQRAVEAAKRRDERMGRLGPPVPIAGEKTIDARVVESQRLASQLSPTEKPSQDGSWLTEQGKTSNRRIDRIQQLTAKSTRNHKAGGDSWKAKARPAPAPASRQQKGRAVPRAAGGKSRDLVVHSGIMAKKCWFFRYNLFVVM